jgi:hypothetical protein
MYLWSLWGNDLPLIFLDRTIVVLVDKETHMERDTVSPDAMRVSQILSKARQVVAAAGVQSSSVRSSRKIID